jgi:hypothetical protein
MRRPQVCLICILVIALLAYGLTALGVVRAGGAVTDCSIYGPGAGTLQAALVGGGTVTFACSGTIVVPEIFISANTTIDATGQNVTLSGNNANRVLNVSSGPTLTLKSLTITKGLADAGGGIANFGTLNMSDCIVSGNSAAGWDDIEGGGIVNWGTMSIDLSTISGNSVTLNGSGFTPYGFGGGISNFGSIGITNSTIAANAITSVGHAAGGGIFNWSVVNITNSTLAGNSVVGADRSEGGAIFNNSGPLSLTYTTIAGNSASKVGGGIANGNIVYMGASILAGNSAPNLPDLYGPIVSQGDNLIGVNAKLGPLANNGGPTQTMALLTGSPAINAVTDCTGGPIADQRGVARPQGIACDIGAFELETAVLKETVGVFRQSLNTFFLKNSNTTGTADITTIFGAAPTTNLPVVGDWDGDGVDTVGEYNSSTGQFFLKNSNAPGSPIVYSPVLGSPGDLPLAGDWNSDGVDGLGVFRPTNGLIYLKNDATTSGFADFTMVLGSPGDLPVAGDWNGDGKDSPGVYRPSLPRFFLTNQVCNCGVMADYSPTLGISGDTPFAGDWTGSGRTGIGVFRPSNGLIYLKNDPTTDGVADINIVFGIPNDLPVAGHWSAGTNIANQPSISASPTPKLAPTFVPKRK